MIRNDGVTEGVDLAERVRAFCFLLATATLRSVAEGIGQARKTPETPARLHVRKARELIWTEFSNPGLTLDKVAWRSGLSAQHLERCFRAEMGMTVFDYLRHVRIEQAKLLLMDTALAVGVIAERVGFSSHALFSRNFRRAAGVDARAFRCSLADAIPEEHL
jgi:transcriptional regulator GlxA family with amidase domain